MSLPDEWAAVGETIHDALEQHSERSAELSGRQKRMEVQWLELQGEIRATLKRLEMQNGAILAALKGNGHG